MESILKTIPLQELESIIAKSLSEATNHELKASIVSITFGNFVGNEGTIQLEIKK